ncbi:hypothetical protein ASH00_09060 [Arthrobacter sp. Soil782]|uniref:hypothetical protein n=1 Tax=Arthrobacter sp. Soil782 TaxID=1736410 RepID=UPI0006F672A8|nr:hypothetical protein [Arthrobacter sp. Soil782]KRF05606.1 hypothetical protein ASH00_09060 [Arthrobacter sp. Soil782]
MNTTTHALRPVAYPCPVTNLVYAAMLAVQRRLQAGTTAEKLDDGAHSANSGVQRGGLAALRRELVRRYEDTKQHAPAALCELGFEAVDGPGLLTLVEPGTAEAYTMDHCGVHDGRFLGFTEIMQDVVDFLTEAESQGFLVLPAALRESDPLGLSIVGKAAAMGTEPKPEARRPRAQARTDYDF